MPPENFRLALDEAGYYIARITVAPIGVIEIRDLIGEMLQRDVELRFVPTCGR